MRDLKFRAWDKDIKKMIFGSWTKESIWEDITHTMTVHFDGDVVEYIGDDGGKNGLWEHEVKHGIEHYELTQYTGLHDKNGKEIYEGDIVKADWGRGEFVAEIMFEDGAFVLGIRNDCYRDMAGEDNNKFYEVIGNIYENPELLENE